MFALVDCNSFYASCEQVFRPDLWGKPVIVLSNNDGCIVARNAEAKKLGINMAAPVFKLREELLQKGVAIFSSNYTLYGDMSERVMKTLAEMVPAMEVYSIDEAFLDLRNMQQRSWKSFAEKLRSRVKQHTKIPTGVGIAPTKTLAKVANHIAKKWKGYHGTCVLQHPDAIKNALERFPIKDLWGIGSRYANKLERYGIQTAGELAQAHDTWILKHLTITGVRLATELRGTPCIELEEVAPPKQNICTARSFGKDITDYNDLVQAVSTYAANCARKLRSEGSAAKQLTVFLHTNTFKPQLPQYSNCKVLQLPLATSSTPQLTAYALRGLKMIFRKDYHYKKAGVMVGRIAPSSATQLSMFTEESNSQPTLMKTMDALNARMGSNTLQFADAVCKDKKWKLRQEMLSPRYTTRWGEMPYAASGGF